MEVKSENAASLIDFDADPEPPAVASSHAQPAVQVIPQPTNSPTDNNWASFDVVPDVKVSQPPASVSSLDILSQLSVPASAPAQLSGAIPPGSSPVLPIVSGPTVQPAGSSPVVQLTPGVASVKPSDGLSVFSHGGASANVPGQNSSLPSNSGIYYSMNHQQPSLFPQSGVHSTHQSTVPVSVAHSQVGF